MNLSTIVKIEKENMEFAWDLDKAKVNSYFNIFQSCYEVMHPGLLIAPPWGIRPWTASLLFLKAATSSKIPTLLCSLPFSKNHLFWHLGFARVPYIPTLVWSIATRVFPVITIVIHFPGF